MISALTQCVYETHRYLIIISSKMFTGKKQVTFDNPSYYDDSSRRYYRDESLDGIRLRLGTNLSKMIEVLTERKELLKKLAELMMSENSARQEHIANAKNTELKNEARILKDQTAYLLLETAQKYNRSTGSIIKTIIELNPRTMEQEQSKKSKQYYDQIRRIDTDRNLAITRFKQQSTDLTKLSDEERKVFRQIQILEQNKIAVLTSKQQDHVRKAERIQEEIERNRMLLKTNRAAKDKRKRQLAFQIEKILEMTKRYEASTIARNNQISQTIGGCETVEEFEQFIRSFETVVASRLDSAKKEDENILLQIVRRAAYYDRQIEQMQKQVSEEACLFDSLQQAYKKNLTIALLERGYLTGVSTDRSTLVGVLAKCQAHRSALQRINDEKAKAKWETDKARQVLDYFEPILKAINSEEKRKEELREKISKIITAKNELDKMEKKHHNFEFQLTNLLLQKESISKPMQEAARRGHLQEYKLKMAQLQKIEQEIVSFSQTKSDHKFKEETAKLNHEIEQLHREYASIIEEMLAGEKEMTFFTFLEKLSKRLMLV